jgi:hypothetical protein
MYCIIEEESYQQFEYVFIFKYILLENIWILFKSKF